MDDQGFESDPPAAYETRQPIFIGSSRRGKFIAAAISAIAIISGAMLLAVTLIPTETMPLCKFDFKSGARLDVGILGFCSSKTKEGELVCNQQIGMKLGQSHLEEGERPEC